MAIEFRKNKHDIDVYKSDFMIGLFYYDLSDNLTVAFIENTGISINELEQILTKMKELGDEKK